MQMNVLRTKQVSQVGNRDDHGQPTAGGDSQRCRRRVGSRQVFRSHLVQTSEHLDANSELNPVDNIQPVQLTSPKMGESPVELVPDDSYCRVEDTLQLVGRLPRRANQETAAIIHSARDERMNECSDRVVIQRTSDAA